MASSITEAPLLLRLVQSSIAAANQAGRIIRDVMSGGELGVVDKGVDDPQTEADRRAQRCIVGHLQRQFPRLRIIGEEDAYLDAANGPAQPSDAVRSEAGADGGAEGAAVLQLQCPDEFRAATEDQFVVWVDPLDGTSEYTQGNLDHVTVLIGVALNGRSVAGVIHQPYHDFNTERVCKGRTLWGVVGVGSGGFRPLAPPDGKIVATTRSHMTPVVQQTLDALKPDQVLKVGGAGYKVMLLMEGKASAYVFASAGCNKWDTCAPEAILTAIGGRLTDIHGRPYPYTADAQHGNRRGVLATARAGDHAWYVDNIPQATLDVLV